MKEKAAEYTALSRQLEAALEEGRQKVQMAFIYKLFNQFARVVSHCQAYSYCLYADDRVEGAAPFLFFT